MKKESPKFNPSRRTLLKGAVAGAATIGAAALFSDRVRTFFEDLEKEPASSIPDFQFEATPEGQPHPLSRNVTQEFGSRLPENSNQFGQSFAEGFIGSDVLTRKWNLNEDTEATLIIRNELSQQIQSALDQCPSGEDKTRIEALLQDESLSWRNRISRLNSVLIPAGYFIIEFRGREAFGLTLDRIGRSETTHIDHDGKSLEVPSYYLAHETPYLGTRGLPGGKYLYGYDAVFHYTTRPDDVEIERLKYHEATHAYMDWRFDMQENRERIVPGPERFGEEFSFENLGGAATVAVEFVHMDPTLTYNRLKAYLRLGHIAHYKLASEYVREAPYIFPEMLQDFWREDEGKRSFDYEAWFRSPQAKDHMRVLGKLMWEEIWESLVDHEG
jgi:hypothetical protein